MNTKRKVPKSLNGVPWFKHWSNSLNKREIQELMLLHGLEGFGLYYVICELIMDTTNERNVSFQLQYSIEIISHRTGMEPSKIEEIMDTLVRLDLFQRPDPDGPIECIALALEIDNATTKSPAIREIKNQLKESGKFQDDPGKVGQQSSLSYSSSTSPSDDDGHDF